MSEEEYKQFIQEVYQQALIEIVTERNSNDEMDLENVDDYEMMMSGGRQTYIQSEKGSQTATGAPDNANFKDTWKSAKSINVMNIS